MLNFVDGRTAESKRYRDLCGTIASDLGGDRCSEVTRQLVRRYAGASILAESIESKIADGETVNISEYAALASVLCRIASRIGIHRIPDVVPSMTEFLRSRGHTPNEQTTQHENSDHGIADEADEEDICPSAPDAEVEG